MKKAIATCMAALTIFGFYGQNDLSGLNYTRTKFRSTSPIIETLQFQNNDTCFYYYGTMDWVVKVELLYDIKNDTIHFTPTKSDKKYVSTVILTSNLSGKKMSFFEKESYFFLDRNKKEGLKIIE